MTEQDAAALRKAMMLDAEWHQADAKFFAACEVREGMPETSRQRRAKWQKEFDAQPDRQKRRNAQRRAARAATSLLTQPGNDG